MLLSTDRFGKIGSTFDNQVANINQLVQNINPSSGLISFDNRAVN